MASPTPNRVPDAQARARIAAEARRGSDTSLPAKDRRNRPRISDRTHHAPESILRVDGEDRELLGPGVGEGWMLLAWVDPEIGDCYGTYHETMIESVVWEGPERGPARTTENLPPRTPRA